MVAIEERLPLTGGPAARWSAGAGTVHLSGVQSVLRMLVEVLRWDRSAGRRTAAFVSGYQGSPLAGFDRALQELLRGGVDVEIVHRAAVNEELGATAVMGSQLAATMGSARLDGVLGVWYGKAPGLDRSADALRHANFAGASRWGGALALVGDDPAAKSSTLPSASEQVLVDLAMPVLFPRTLADVIELGHHAVALSRWSGAWVACKLVTSVADAEGTVVIGEPPAAVLSEGWEPAPVTGDLLTPATLRREPEVAERRLDAAARYGDANGLNRLTVDPPSASVALMAAGTVYSELVEALRLLGLEPDALAALGIRLAEVRMPYPLGPRFIERVAAGVDEVVVVEERREVLEHQVLSSLGRRRGGPAVIGRFDDHGARFVAPHGTLDAPTLARILQPRLAARFGSPVRPVRERITLPVTVSLPDGAERVPWFCSGCPHSASTRVPAGTLVGAGIGCHAIVKFMPEEQVGRVVGVTQMGGEGAQWIGLAPFVDDEHFVQNLGDGTFFHSGHLAVRAAVAAGARITFKILWNGASAMTGGQAVEGATGSPLALAQLLRLEGVARIVITTNDVRRYRRRRLPAGVEVRPRSDIVVAQEALAEVAGVTVLIHDQACATELRRARKRGRVPAPKQAVVINERVCEGCGDCQVKSNCLSLQTVTTPFGPKTRIDAATCNVDLACLAGDCPAFTLVEAGRAPGANAAGDPDALTGDLPPAPPPAPGATIRIAGIGGTGVVTTAHLLARAAMLEGREVWGLDQTGLSQKAGAVVSDLRIGPGAGTRSNILGAGEVDVLIAADLMAAARPSVLEAAAAERTDLVASTTAVLSGPMILGVADRAVPVGEFQAALKEACRPGATFLDADALARRLAGSAAAANVVLLGVAAQKGLLPVTPESVEAAISHNGVAVTASLAAFRAGRTWAAGLLDTDAPPADTPAIDQGVVAGVDLPAARRGDITRLAAELVRYQSPRLARRFLDLVEETWAAERAAGGDGTLTGAVAAGYHKLLAYKDEYEVARLLVDHPASPGRTTWLLHPPVLRAAGLSRKLRLGPWAAPALRLLRAGRHLRGTALDPFGHTGLRRQERDLPASYAAAIRSVLAGLDPESLGAATEIARLPETVRGYENVKLDAIARYRAELESLLATLHLRSTGADRP